MRALFLILFFGVLLMPASAKDRVAEALIAQALMAQAMQDPPQDEVHGAWSPPSRYPDTPQNHALGRRQADQLARDMEAWQASGRVGKKPIPRVPRD